jgi:hypothetical protein
MAKMPIAGQRRLKSASKVPAEARPNPDTNAARTTPRAGRRTQQERAPCTESKNEDRQHFQPRPLRNSRHGVGRARSCPFEAAVSPFVGIRQNGLITSLSARPGSLGLSP